MIQTEKYTIDYIIKILATDGINARKKVRDMLKNAKSYELDALAISIKNEAAKRRLDEIK